MQHYGFFLFLLSVAWKSFLDSVQFFSSLDCLGTTEDLVISIACDIYLSLY